MSELSTFLKSFVILRLRGLLFFYHLLVSPTRAFNNYGSQPELLRQDESIHRIERGLKTRRTSHELNSNSKNELHYASENIPLLYSVKDINKRSLLQKRDEWLDDTKRQFKENKYTVTDPELILLRNTDAQEQKRQKSALEADSSFENEALASLEQDEKHIMEDEEKVNEDRRRKFGKHHKRSHDDNSNNGGSRTIKELRKEAAAKSYEDEESEDEDKTDLYTKIREFANALSTPKQRHFKGVHAQTSKREARSVEDELKLDDNVLKGYASDDSDNSYVAETSETPSQILGNIAKIFEDVNKDNEEAAEDASGGRKRKNIIPIPSPELDPIPRPFEEGDVRKVKDVIPRPPPDVDARLSEKYDTIERRNHRAEVGFML